jgi:hypothetical protein
LTSGNDRLPSFCTEAADVSGGEKAEEKPGKKHKPVKQTPGQVVVSEKKGKKSAGKELTRKKVFAMIVKHSKNGCGHGP